MDNTKIQTRRLPAEWEYKAPVVLVALPHNDTDWCDMLGQVHDCYRQMIATISRHAPVVVIAPDIDQARNIVALGESDNVSYRQVMTNDTWTRDYAPITVECGDGSYECLDFTFNGWGLKFAADLDNLVNRCLQDGDFFARPLESHKEFVLEGGSIDSDGNGNLLVTSRCLLSPNRNPDLDRRQIEYRLKKWLGVEHVHWIEAGYLAGDDTDSHIDTLARFAPSNQIVYVACDDPSDQHYRQLKDMEAQLAQITGADGVPVKLVALPMPDAIYDELGMRMPATYANFLALDNVVVMPTYRQPHNDRVAADILRSVFMRPVVGVDCHALVMQHGSLHCSTMQMPKASIK